MLLARHRVRADLAMAALKTALALFCSSHIWVGHAGLAGAAAAHLRELRADKPPGAAMIYTCHWVPLYRVATTARGEQHSFAVRWQVAAEWQRLDVPRRHCEAFVCGLFEGSFPLIDGGNVSCLDGVA